MSNLKDFNNFTIFFLQAYRIFVIFISTDMLKIYYLRISDFQHLSEDELFPLVGEDTVRKVTGYKNPGVRRTKLLGEDSAVIVPFVGTAQRRLPHPYR